MDHLYEKLFRYAGTDIYPYHMPGHKRQGWGMLPEAIYKMDITEIDGFDNLHQPEEILLELQKEAAKLYGAEESYYLVNGSTSGILSAVSSAVPFGGRILMARNCHKSAYHAAYLRQLRVGYLWPRCLEMYGIFDAVTPEQVRNALDDAPETQAVLLVSPTYEGRIADISSIAGIVHEKGIPLIVDEAHGAHLGLAEGFPENSCQAGADLVIHSVHKTLPALTQTALLHVNGDLIDRNKLRRFLHIYQTSSPSYPLMASIDNALQYVELQGKVAFKAFRERYGKMMALLEGCRFLEILLGEGREQDIGKLVVSVRKVSLTGKQLADILLKEYHLQMEMVSGDFVLAMFTVNDGEAAYRRMTEALLEIDRGLGKRNFRERYMEKSSGKDFFREEQERKIIPLARAWDMAAEEAALEDSIGRYVADFVNLYPPGVPLLVPGEQLTEEMYRQILGYLEAGLDVQGIRVDAGCCLGRNCYYIQRIREKN